MTPFQLGDTVRFTCSKHWIVGRVEEIRQGFEGNFLLVVRQGIPLTGSRFVVLSSYAEIMGTVPVPIISPGALGLPPRRTFATFPVVNRGRSVI